MSMNNLDLLPNDNVSKDWEKGEDGRKGCGAIDDQEGNMVDFETIRKISHSSSTFVCVCNHHDFVSSINEFCGELVNVTFDASGLWKEIVADHSNIVRHRGDDFEAIATSLRTQSAFIPFIVLIVAGEGVMGNVWRTGGWRNATQG